MIKHIINQPIKNINWYELYQFKCAISSSGMIKTASLQKESGLKEIFLAISLLLGGANMIEVAQAAERAHTDLKTIQRLAKDPKVVKQMAQKTESTPTSNDSTQSKVNIDDLIKAIVTHEGLAPGQTPFRITSPEMAKWDHIYGFQIDKTRNANKDRKNFIFLKNQNEVVPAVKKLFEKYVSDPARYSLPKDVTLRQAIEKFDQSGSKGKIEFIKKRFPNLNFDFPLKSFF